MEKLLLEREKEKQVQEELIKKLLKEADQWSNLNLKCEVIIN